VGGAIVPAFLDRRSPHSIILINQTPVRDIMRWMLRSKIHRATVTETRLDYEGSITIDEGLLERSGIWAGEKVLVADVDNGNRCETYVLPGKRDSGIIALNGAAAHLFKEGDKVIIMGFELTDEPIRAKVLLVDESNKILRELVY
jgi:aspartate 1-decarboxylase